MPQTQRRMAQKASRRSSCPIACSLDLFGDRWTLVVIRDLFRGLKYYREFEDSAEGIPTNILAERLRRLEQAGLIRREPYQQNPPRYAYSLTQKGEDLKPVLASLALWAMRHLPELKPNPKLEAVLRG